MTKKRAPLLLAAAVSLAITLTAPGDLLADMPVHEWFGDWTMYHDGHTADLTISETKADCGGPAWCATVLHYTGPSGNRSRGSIQSIDGQGQHMVFEIGNKRFDGYLFSWDHKKMAGSYAYGDRRFGFYAVKR